jgi:hypothetical protein
MVIYRVRYRETDESRVIAWAETKVAAEICRAEIEKRHAAKQVPMEIKRFEVHLSRNGFVRFLNEHATA